MTLTNNYCHRKTRVFRRQPATVWHDPKLNNTHIYDKPADLVFNADSVETYSSTPVNTPVAEEVPKARNSRDKYDSLSRHYTAYTHKDGTSVYRDRWAYSLS